MIGVRRIAPRMTTVTTPGWRFRIAAGIGAKLPSTFGLTGAARMGAGVFSDCFVWHDSSFPSATAGPFSLVCSEPEMDTHADPFHALRKQLAVRTRP